MQEKIELPVRRTKTPARPKREEFIRDDDSASSSAASEGGELQMATRSPQGLPEFGVEALPAPHQGPSL